VAVMERTRAQEVKPAKGSAPAARSSTTSVKPPGATVRPLMPSPQVAAAILDGADQTPRVSQKAPQKRPPAAPLPASAEKSPARVKVPEPIPRSPTKPVVPPPPVMTTAVALVQRPEDERVTPRAAAPNAAASLSAPRVSKSAPLAPPAGPAPLEAEVAPAEATAPSGAVPEAKTEAGRAGEKTAAQEKEGAPKESKEGAAKGEGKAPGKEGGKEGKGKGDKKGKEAGEEGAGEEGGGAGGAAAVVLLMPEPPSEPSQATKKRIAGVKGRAGKTASVKADLPKGDEQVGDARGAVDQPDAEAQAQAKEALIVALGKQPEPSPEIVKLCERIREVIRKKRPPDEDALMAAEPEGEALDAGNQLNSTVQDETKKVESNYATINEPPAAAPAAKGAPLPEQPEAAPTPEVKASAATPDPVPDANVSLDADAAASQQKIQDAGMEKPAAALVQTGPIAEARAAQGELDQAAKEDPAKVLAGQKDALAKADADMAALQEQALTALTASRGATTKKATAGQKGMVESEAATRTRVSGEAQQIFNDAQTAVNNLLKPLVKNALDQWEAAKTVLVTQFKNDLAVVQRKVDERHSGVGGFFVGLWDAVTGLPDWAEKAYTKAEYNFSEGVIAKITQISVEVNTVIATCELLISTARDRIAKLFEDNKKALGDWAETEKAKFDKQLDTLQAKALATRDDFNKDLVQRSSAAVDEVRTEIAELRKKAGGLLGRIANAISRFIDDPIKFIIEGLLDLLGIPPAAFWAVVAKIKKVISDIADDPLGFASNLLAGLAQGFSLFFENFPTHLLKGFINWLTGGLAEAGVELPKDLSLKSIVTFFMQLMGITWPRIRKVLAKHVGEKNIALLEKVYSMVSFLIEKGPEGIFEMIQEKLNPQSIVDQVIQLAVDFMVSAIIKAATARIIALFNPVGAIVQALEAIYRVLKWIFQNAAKIFTLIETVVNGIADVIAGNIGGFAAAVEKALTMLIAPVIAFIADYLGFGDLPKQIAEKIKSFQEWIMGLIEQALVFLIEKGKALLAAVGIGGKKEEKDGKARTPHEESVHDVVATLSQPPKGQPLPYEALRAAKEKEADSLAAIHNQSLASEKVKMSIIFAERSKDEVDHDLDFKVIIAPNQSEEDGAVPAPVPEPVAGLHRVERPAPFEAVRGESHHVPAKGLGTGIAQFLEGVADKLRSGEWQDDAAAQAVAAAFSARADTNSDVAAEPGFGLSAIMLCPEAHTEAGGVHTVEGSGPILLALAENPVGRAIVQVKRRTKSRIGAVTSFLAVNPQIPSWRIFLADVRRALDDPRFRNNHDLPPTKAVAVDLILEQAEKEFMDADESSQAYLQDRIVDRTNAVLDRAVGDGYKSGKATVSAAMDRANDGTPAGRRAALASLDGHFGSSWAQFRRPIRVSYPTGGSS
jgi:hypothetical protein